jgi:hypothetical protein
VISKSLRRAFLAFILASVCPWAGAEVRFEGSHVWRHARLLTPGQQLLSLQTSYQNVTDRFAADGRLEPMGGAYGRKVTWGQLVRAESSQGRAELRNYMRQKGVGDNDVAATSTYKVTREEIGLELNWAYGLTSNWMIGLRLPLVRRTTRVQQHIAMVPDLALGARQKLNGSFLGGGDAVGDRVAELAQGELANSGYDRVPDEKQSLEWGDISLMSQEGLYQTYHWRWSLQQALRFPTAQNPSLSDYIQMSNDEGQVDLGATSMVEYQSGRWTTGWRVGYVAQLPDTPRMRVPDGGQGTRVEPTVRRDLGDWIWTSLDGEVRLTRRWDFNLEHSLLSKARDHYTGSSLPAEDYEALAMNTDQQLQQTRLGFLYRPTAISVRDGVFNRWATAVDFTYPWIGRNAADASQASFEVISYF